MFKQLSFHILATLTACSALFMGCDLQGENQILVMDNLDNRQVFATDRHGDLAVGTQSRLEFRRDILGSGGALQITDAGSSDPTIIRVLKIDTNTVTVEALKAGTIDLTIESDDVSDSFTLQAHTVAKTKFMTAESFRYVLIDSVTDYQIIRFDDEGSRLSGRRPLDVDTNNPGIAIITDIEAEQEQFSVRFVKAGDVEINVGETNIKTTVVGVDAVAELNAELPNLFEDEDGSWNDIFSISALTKEGARIAGVGAQLVVKTNSEHCSAAASDIWGQPTVMVSGQNRDACTVTLTLNDQTITRAYPLEE